MLPKIIVLSLPVFFLGLALGTPEPKAIALSLDSSIRLWEELPGEEVKLPPRITPGGGETRYRKIYENATIGCIKSRGFSPQHGQYLDYDCKVLAP